MGHSSYACLLKHDGLHSFILLTAHFIFASMFLIFKTRYPAYFSFWASGLSKCHWTSLLYYPIDTKNSFFLFIFIFSFFYLIESFHQLPHYPAKTVAWIFSTISSCVFRKPPSCISFYILYLLICPLHSSCHYHNYIPHYSLPSFL